MTTYEDDVKYFLGIINDDFDYKILLVYYPYKWSFYYKGGNNNDRSLIVKGKRNFKNYNTKSSRSNTRIITNTRYLIGAE